MAFYDSPLQQYSSSSFYYNDYYYSDPEQVLLPYHHSSCYSYSYTPYSSGIEFLEPPSYKLSISYSVARSEFDEEFEEYDPTPYNGGYDQAATYGSPLPPSDAICYPRTLPPVFDAISPEAFSFNSIPSPYGNDDEPQIESKPRPLLQPPRPLPQPPKPVEQEVVEIGGDYPHQAYGAGYFYGSGLESVDLCEGLFGYWPCWAKREEQERLFKESEERRREDPNPWDLCAEYFFSGAPTTFYDDDDGDGDGDDDDDEAPYYQNQW